MVRAAAKNYKSVAVVTDPEDYGPLLCRNEILRRRGERRISVSVSPARLFRIPLLTIAPSAITSPRSVLTKRGKSQAFPERLNLNFSIAQHLRYGENPHQQASFYRDLPLLPAALPAMPSCRARSCHTTTSLMRMRRGSVSKPLICLPASFSSMPIPAA